MKQHWQRFALKFDMLTLRERAIIFAMAALMLITLVNALLLDPQFSKQKKLTQRIKQDQATMTELQAQMQATTTASEIDPDKANKQHLQEIKDQLAQMKDTLRGLEKEMVPPEKMSALLEDILRQNRALRLVSLKTLSASELVDQEETAGDKACSFVKGVVQGALKGKAEEAASTVYKHGVEIVVQGAYLDLMNYLAQLEAMPWQLLWDTAKLEAEDYPKSTLTLRLYTLSLDRKWLNL